MPHFVDARDRAATIGLRQPAIGQLAAHIWLSSVLRRDRVPSGSTSLRSMDAAQVADERRAMVARVSPARTERHTTRRAVHAWHAKGASMLRWHSVEVRGRVFRLAWAATLCLAATSALAARPEVEFDAPAAVAASDITTAAFRAAHPGEKLIAVRIEISSLVRRGETKDLAEVLYRVEATDRDMELFDFGPKTTLAPLAAGSVAVERDTDARTSVRANVAGRYFPFAEGDAALSKEVNEQMRLRYELPAPQEVVVTSGSSQRRRGVFVKLRASRRGSLEGANAVVAVYVVPQNWRGGIFVVEAEARSTVGGALGEQGDAVVCGTASFATGVYLAGDLVARDAVERLVAAEKAYRDAEAEHAGKRKRDFDDTLRDAFDGLVALAGDKPRQNRRAADRLAAEAILAAQRAARDRTVERLTELNALPAE